jgi:hypothetical protein
LTLCAAIGLVLLCAWTFWELGGFELTSTVRIAGESRSVVNAFATVDHPFHAVRADLLLKSLEIGRPLRWIASHQGGYPVEFYPLGIAWLDVGLWITLLGQVPIIAVHKLAVLIVFVLPAVGFWILARGDRLHPFVPLLALAVHLAVPGDWMHGGRMELVYWGLIANVGGATLAFIMLAALNRFALEAHRGYGLLAVGMATAALYTNTRSSIAVVIGTMAIVAMATILKPSDDGPGVKAIISRIGLVAAATALLTAPLLLSMARYSDLYYFVNFEEYASIRQYWDASTTAITPIVVVLAVGGLAVALSVRTLVNTRAVACAFLLYVIATLAFSIISQLGNLIPQLETPRLMPYQRFLAIYLAAVCAAWLGGRFLTLLMVRKHELGVAALLALAAIVTLLVFRGTFGELDPVYEQPRPWTTGIPEYAEFNQAIDEATDVLPDGTAIFVVGDQQSWWHEQLWGPVWSEAPFFYDDWMWYWHEDHDGPYDNTVGHAYHDPAAAFKQQWLRAHGVGAIVVTNMPVPVGATDPRIAARSDPDFEYLETIGQWDLYRVANPGAIVTNGDIQPSSVKIENETITANFTSASGQIQVRRNWFPRWRAFANGEPVAIEREADGYMSLDVPDGTTEVELRYAATTLDWIGRLAAVFGVVLSIFIALGVTPACWRRWATGSR